jgi:hypothetical protein
MFRIGFVEVVDCAADEGGEREGMLSYGACCDDVPFCGEEIG